MAENCVELLWGTANLFSHTRYAAGAATNPNPEVFAHAAAQVRNMLDATHWLGSRNYVLWGGREGYETLLNTRMAQEADQLARFLTMVAESKHRIGFTGTFGPARKRGMEGCQHWLGSCCREFLGLEVGGVGEAMGVAFEDLERVVGVFDVSVAGLVGVVSG